MSRLGHHFKGVSAPGIRVHNGQLGRRTDAFVEGNFPWQDVCWCVVLLRHDDPHVTRDRQTTLVVRRQGETVLTEEAGVRGVGQLAVD
ncbi:hypothetical protein D9M68_974340 [compost metagenome]